MPNITTNHAITYTNKLLLLFVIVLIWEIRHHSTFSRCGLKIFSGSGIWSSIRCEIRENANYIDRKRNLTATREAVFLEIRARGCEIFLSVYRTDFGGKWYVLAANANNQTGESSVVSPSISLTSSFIPLFPSASSY